VGGEVVFEGRDLLGISEPEMRSVRGAQIAMIFQEPMTSLNPVFTVGNQVGEAIRLHQHTSRAETRDRSIEALRLVGIADPERRIDDYPHQLSGGMRQRVMIAMALACKPRLLIADEPTTALDVTIQAQILELMKELTRQLGVAMIVITHNLGVVARYADRVNVMYAGRIVESGDAEQIYHSPKHPYTLALLRSVPRMDMKRGGRLHPVGGQPPDLTKLDEGCSFRPRCSFATAECARSKPALEAVDEGHVAACFNRDKVALGEIVG
jgi:oligopeptide/dipeptide ABC transporter ATP-binding protein